LENVRGEKSTKLFEDIQYVLDRKEELGVKEVYLEINQELVGFAIGIKYSDEKNSPYIALFNYAIRKPRDIHYFLKVERAKLFNSQYFLDSVF
jgi:hypothetical protein